MHYELFIARQIRSEKNQMGIIVCCVCDAEAAINDVGNRTHSQTEIKTYIHSEHK